uniref:Uncharacterized protein n=1 Tax=Myoviridae sp. ctRPH1 TaxID=2826650 RepID=A0A8S5MAU1_9CAUD|nr:MAG TPA: hypothetical protein [Myoviridae sp. ctRPH1]
MLATCLGRGVCTLLEHRITKYGTKSPSCIPHIVRF